MAKNKNGLTKQQQGFCDTLRCDPTANATQAYIANYRIKSEAGARVNASKLLTNANIVKYLILKQEIAEEKADYTQEEMINDLLRLKRICMSEESFIELVTRVIDDKPATLELEQRTLNAPAANKAIELLAKAKGFITDKPMQIAIQSNQAVQFVAAKMDEEG